MMPFDDVVDSSMPILGPVPTTTSSLSNITTWPWPRIMMTEYHTFAFTVQASGNLVLSEVVINAGRVTFTVVLNIGLASLISQVDIADFGPFYVLTTYGLTADLVPVPSIKTFVRDVNIPVSLGCLIPFTTPTVGTCCNFKGQFVGGNILFDPMGIYGNLGSDAMVWSGIGNFEFNPVTDPTAGFRRIPFPNSIGKQPTIYKIFPHHTGLVIYSDAGRAFLSLEAVESTATYSLQPLKGLGIASGNHVAGNQYIQGFIDLYGDFWVWELQHATVKFDGGVVKKLGYRSYIKELLDYSSEEDHRVIVSYIDKTKRFYISNGNQCLVINEFGACGIFQCVSSVIVGYDGRLYGTFRNTQDTEGRFVSGEVDFGTRALKSVESMIGSIKHASDSSLHFAVDWRMSNDTPFKRTPWKPTGPQGEAVIKVTAAAFRICGRISNYVDAEIEYLALNLKYPDNRFKRGPTLDPANVVSTKGEV